MNFNFLLFIGVIPLIIVIVIYIFGAYCLQRIATKTNTPNGWLAYIPLINAFLVIQIAEKPLWWFVLFLIPLVNIIVLATIWWKIAERLNKPGWTGLLIFVPIVNLIVLGYWAFSE